MFKIVLVVFVGISAFFAEAGEQETQKDESLLALRRIDCVVKKLNWMINVTENVLVRFRKHVEEAYKKRYFLEEKCTAWKELFLYVNQFVKEEQSNEIKEILNEMERIVETESYLQNKYEASVSNLDKETVDVLSTGIRYAATMEEMYRVGLEAVRLEKQGGKCCGSNVSSVTCWEPFVAENISYIIGKFNTSSDGRIDLGSQKSVERRSRGIKLVDRVDAASTTYGHIIKHRGIRSNLGKDKAPATQHGWVKHVHLSKLLQDFVMPLTKIDYLTSEIETMPSKLSECASRVDALSSRLQSLFSDIATSTT